MISERMRSAKMLAYCLNETNPMGGAADRSKSALGFADLGFWQICARTACSCRSCADCDWVAGSGFYHAGAICARQTPIRELHATCTARLLWPFITSQRELRRSGEHHGRCNGKICKFAHAIPLDPCAFRQASREKRLPIRCDAHHKMGVPCLLGGVFVDQ
jgi:hypothetical protein